VVPELAERYETNADSSEYTFYLRKGVKFHDGTIMTADDFVASMNGGSTGFPWPNSLPARLGSSRWTTTRSASPSTIRR
jgi:ABC-type transport system substrate-binding protein